MGLIGDIAQSLITKNDTGTTLESFLSKYSSTQQKYVDTIDPYSTFDVFFKFYPTEGVTKKQSTMDKLVGLGKSAVQNTLNNATGGLLGSIINSSAPSIMKLKEEFKQARSHTFLEYLASANMLVGGEDWLFNSNSVGQAITPLELSLGPYVQDIVIPSMNVAVENTTTQIGDFPIVGNYVKTENQNLVMSIINTKAALHERIFYPWMRETTLPFWSYKTQPYTTATITIDYTKHNDVKYVFCGCRPTNISMIQANQDTSDGANLKRSVTFTFDYMFIHSKLKTQDDPKDMLLDTGMQLFNSAAKTINL